MSELFDFDPISGIKTELDWGPDETVTIKRTAEVKPVIDYAVAHANHYGKDEAAIKHGWWCYATLPAAVILELKQKKGIDVFNRDHQDRMFQEINMHYPHLKMVHATEGSTTEKKFFLPGK